jgi:GNAT superfamily N-acetyltransferase
MLWRLSAAEFNRMKGSGNKRAIHRIVTSGEIPGLIAYHDGQPVGWCSLGPRERFIRLENSRVLKRADDQPVWSVSCLFIDRKHRRQGISVKLLQGAVSFARKHKAQILEGYPTDSPNRTSPDAFVWTGLASAYRRAGFAEVLRRSPIRPIMRFNLTQRRRQPQHRSDIG